MIEYPYIPHSAINATPGTGIAIASATRTTLDTTEAALALRSTDDRVILPQRLSLTCRTAGTGVTAMWAALAIDSAWRRSSGGTLLEMSETRRPTAPTGLQVYFGNITMTAPAGGNSRIIWHEQLLTAAPTVGQRLEINFDDAAGLWPQVAVPPGSALVLYYWATGQSASPTYEPKLLFGVK